MTETQTSKIPILLLKTKSVPNDGYEEFFSHGTKDENSRYNPVFVPVMEHKFLEDGLDFVRKLLKKREVGREESKAYGGLIFTSQRAVEAFARLVDDEETDAPKIGTLSEIPPTQTGWPHLQDVPIYTVGPATSRALKSIPQTPPLNIYGSETGNGEALAHYMLDHYGEWHKDRYIKPPLLFLVGEQRRDIIPKTLMDSTLPVDRQIKVDELVIYGTGVMESFKHDFANLLRESKEKDVRWVVVFSPTGCQAMLEALQLLDPVTGRAKTEESGEVYISQSKTYIATIGPTTRDFLRSSFGFEPDVCAERPSPEGVGEAIKIFMDKNYEFW